MSEKKSIFDNSARNVHLTARKLLELTEQSQRQGLNKLFLHRNPIESFIIVGRVISKRALQNEGKVIFTVEDSTGIIKIESHEFGTVWLKNLLDEPNAETRFIVRYEYNRVQPIYISNLIAKIEDCNELITHLLMCFIQERQQPTEDQIDLENNDDDDSANNRSDLGVRTGTGGGGPGTVAAYKRTAALTNAQPTEFEIAEVRSYIQDITEEGGVVTEDAIIRNLENIDPVKIVAAIFILQEKKKIVINANAEISINRDV